jgi:HSP20 family protein
VEHTNYLLREYGVGDFRRTFQIGEGIDAAKIAAELREGVLTVHLPKAPELMPRKIAVKANV